MLIFCVISAWNLKKISTLQDLWKKFTNKNCLWFLFLQDFHIVQNRKVKTCNFAGAEVLPAPVSGGEAEVLPAVDDPDQGDYVKSINK